MAKVTFVSFMTSVVAIWGLNSHTDAMPDARFAVESVEKSVYLQIVLQLIGHFLLNSLHD